MLTEIGVNYCHVCGSSDLKSAPQIEGRYQHDSRDRLVCQRCSAKVNITHFVVKRSEFWPAFTYIADSGKRVIAFGYKSKVGRFRFALAGFIRKADVRNPQGMTEEEVDFLRYRVADPNARLERQGRLVITKG